MAGVNPRRRYADLDAGQLHYAEQGAGPALVLLGETPRGWRFFEPLLPHLPPGRRALAIDLPGLGQSTPLPALPSMEALAGSVVALLDALGIARADIVGMHTGNKVAAAIAAGWPDRTDRLVLAGQSHSLHPDAALRNAALGPFFSRYRAERAGDDPAAQLRAWLGAKLALDATWWAGDAPLGDQAAIRSAEAKAVDFLAGWRSAVPIYEAVFAQDFAAAVGRVAAETLVLELLSPDEADQHGSGAQLAALMPRATTASLPVDHLSGMERQPAEIAAAVLSLLDQDPRS